MARLPRVKAVPKAGRSARTARRYMDKKSPEYQAVLDAVKTLVEKEGWDIAGTALAEAQTDYCLESYEKEHGVQEGDSMFSGSIAQLLGTDDELPQHFPGGDHDDLWLQNGEVVRFSTQPYGPISEEKLRKMLDFCETHCLEMTISARSYHFPGRTLFIDVARKEARPGPQLKDIRRKIKAITTLSGKLYHKWDNDPKKMAVLLEQAASLDEQCRPPKGGVAVGRLLKFEVVGGKAYYLIDQVTAEKVHCEWIHNGNQLMSDAVDDDGWCLRTVAERALKR